ncbi:hypothetical protein PSTT_12588 [Puccinia striiformis]|uniref:No apical meristem-associated C-terminal domain-containing protein n=2 Tax=Puccinia striiformis TaxID=27350 RepID=A0A0L0VJF2_9BASI|nr:hypothetical protein PSTG_07603 [Puccinia striiformis f. sp. tritici PST-78]POW01266.1 hypothetical protein PSTT_12588 [Puccinia striiformis]
MEQECNKDGPTGDCFALSGNYKERKDVEMCKAWAAITEDSQVGTNQELKKFWARIHNVKNLNPNGRTLKDKLEMTQRTYKVDQGGSFPHIWCYNVLVKCAKWRTYCHHTIEKEAAQKKCAKIPNNND